MYMYDRKSGSILFHGWRDQGGDVDKWISMWISQGAKKAPFPGGREGGGSCHIISSSHNVQFIFNIFDLCFESRDHLVPTTTRIKKVFTIGELASAAELGRGNVVHP